MTTMSQFVGTRECEPVSGVGWNAADLRYTPVENYFNLQHAIPHIRSCCSSNGFFKVKETHFVSRRTAPAS